jgi:hypothetical protein
LQEIKRKFARNKKGLQEIKKNCKKEIKENLQEIKKICKKEIKEHLQERKENVQEIKRLQEIKKFARNKKKY